MRGTLATSSHRYWKKFICRQSPFDGVVRPTEGSTLGTLKMFPWEILESQFQAFRFTFKAGNRPVDSRVTALQRSNHIRLPKWGIADRVLSER
jgi:hypothetical protein